MNAADAARRALAELITPQRWGAFVAWLEEAEEGGDGVCAHDPLDYEQWLRDHGERKKLRPKAEAIWDAMVALGKGPCRCNAGTALWRGDELDDVVFPIMYAKVSDLPRALTGLPETLSVEQQALFGKFYGARRGGDTLFKSVPEPPFSGDVSRGMAMAGALAWLARWSPACEHDVQSSYQNVSMFFHSGSFDDVAEHYRKSGTPMIPFEKVLEDLSVYAVQRTQGTPAHDLVIHTADGPRRAGLACLHHVVVARPADGTVLVDGVEWLPFPADGLRVSGDGGSVTLLRQAAGLHVVHLT